MNAFSSAFRATYKLCSWLRWTKFTLFYHIRFDKFGMGVRKLCAAWTSIKPHWLNTIAKGCCWCYCKFPTMSFNDWRVSLLKIPHSILTFFSICENHFKTVSRMVVVKHCVLWLPAISSFISHCERFKCKQNNKSCRHSTTITTKKK